VDAGVVAKIRAAGGEVYGVTSEPQTLADQAHEEWRLDFETIGDPHHEISRTCQERGWLELNVQHDFEFIQRGASWEVQHPRGYFQPGVLAVTGASRLLYRWRSIPSRENLFGTVGRPTAEHVWGKVEEALAAADDAADAALDEAPVVDGAGPPLPLFIALVIANGWFVRARAMAFEPGSRRAYAKLRAAFVRLVAFVVAWVLAFATLPKLPVALLLAAWGMFISREVRWIVSRLRAAEASAT
jgi:hypothetical protein